MIEISPSLVAVASLSCFFKLEVRKVFLSLFYPNESVCCFCSVLRPQSFHFAVMIQSWKWPNNRAHNVNIFLFSCCYFQTSLMHERKAVKFFTLGDFHQKQHNIVSSADKNWFIWIIKKFNYKNFSTLFFFYLRTENEREQKKQNKTEQKICK